MTTLQVQNLLSYLHTEYPRAGFDPGPLDGLTGPKTTAAITAFQKKFGGLTVTGTADEDTQKALKHAVAYGMELPEPEEDKTSTFWDEIPNFRREEFACKCGQYCDGFPAEPREDLVRLAQGARDHFGVEGLVVSGLRCERWNAIQGGVSNSQHMYGEALDIRFSGKSASQVLDYFLAQPGVRYAYAINETNVHVDVPKGVR